MVHQSGILHSLKFCVLGVRLLLESRADYIIREVRDILHDTVINPFRTTDRTTRILSGEEEGAFQWITVNYLRGYFDRPGKVHDDANNVLATEIIDALKHVHTDQKRKISLMFVANSLIVFYCSVMFFRFCLMRMGPYSDVTSGRVLLL